MSIEKEVRGILNIFLFSLSIVYENTKEIPHKNIRMVSKHKRQISTDRFLAQKKWHVESLTYIFLHQILFCLASFLLFQTSAPFVEVPKSLSFIRLITWGFPEDLYHTVISSEVCWTRCHWIHKNHTICQDLNPLSLFFYKFLPFLKLKPNEANTCNSLVFYTYIRLRKNTILLRYRA